MQRVLLVGVLAVAGCHEVFSQTRPEDDAAVIPSDAPLDSVPDALSCPPTYEMVPRLASRYRIIETGAPMWVQHATCTEDGVGTHLMAASNENELILMHEHLTLQTGLSDPKVWIGVVQRPDAIAPSLGWINVTDEPPALFWASVEPNDRDTVEDKEEQFAHLEVGEFRYLIDNSGVGQYPAVCECDGRAVTEEARAAIIAGTP